MPTVLGPKYATSWRGKPPHMLKVDIPIWYSFLEKQSSIFVELYYDCLLGGPSFVPPEYDERLRNMWVYLGSKRADVIGYTKSAVWIIEVTNEAKIKALGQLMLYKFLWDQDPKSSKPVKLVLVCDFEDSDLFASAKSYGIRIFVEGGGQNSTTKTQP